MNEMNGMSALMGGICIGLSASLLLWLNGRIAGISGIFRHMMPFRADRLWALLFIAGLPLGCALYEYAWASQATPTAPALPAAMLFGGFLVGLGSRLGKGCTSGHGVCGLGFFSKRSFAAVMTFMATAMITVWILRHSGLV